MRRDRLFTNKREIAIIVANGGILRAFLLTKARDTTIMT